MIRKLNWQKNSLNVTSKQEPSGWRGRAYLYRERLAYMALMWRELQKNFGKMDSKLEKKLSSKSERNSNYMEKEIIKTITLRPVRVIRQSKQNPYMRGLVLKREVTTREACHIYRNIFLFNIDLSLNDMEDKDEKNYFYSDITEKMNSYLKGYVGWSSLCDATYCYDVDDDDTGASVASHLKLVEYLQKRGVL